ncbi:MAG TPA: ABC transporter permease [Pyrinomonadaceae bacterium]
MPVMISAQAARRAVWRPLWELPQRWDLIVSLARRELAARYKGSAGGLLWAVLTPLVMIGIFTFVFAKIFGARFGAGGSAWEFALYLFCGLLPWTAFSESVQTSTQTIVSHANLVKRVVFPLELLPASHVLASFMSQMFGTVALLIAIIIIQGKPHLSILWLPVVVVPQLLATLGVAWLVASLGVYLRDMVQAMSLILMAWLYLTPIIYPETVVPDRYRWLLNLNPFTPLIRSYRQIMLEGRAPDWQGLAYFTLFALVAFLFGYWWFARTRRGFADVI